MKNQNILIAHPQDDNQLNTIKAFFEALKIKFEISNESPYNKAFVEKIELSKKQAENGNTTRVGKENLKEFLGL